MMAASVQEFIGKMSAFFGPPYKNAEDDLIMPVLTKHLAEFDEAVLDGAFEHLLMTHKFKTWPMPKEIIAACNLVKFKLRPEPQAIDDNPWSDERIRLADLLIKCDLGIQAAEGGWLDELWRFCRETQRLPEGEKEVDRVFKQAEKNLNRFNRGKKRVINDRGWKKSGYPLRTACLKLAESMQEQWKRREEMVLAWADKRISGEGYD